MDKSKMWEVAPKQLDRVLTFFARIEAKASFIFAVDSALLGTVAVHIDRSDIGRGWSILSLAFFGIAIAASYFYVYRASFPNLKGGHSSMVYFREIAKLREQEFVKSFQAQSEEAYIDDIVSQVWRNSQNSDREIQLGEDGFRSNRCQSRAMDSVPSVFVSRSRRDSGNLRFQYGD